MFYGKIGIVKELTKERKYLNIERKEQFIKI